jgi:6-phosphogluconolactonase (cycloisomerase 2 family)
MRFTKFGKALCMGALSAGVAFGITSCDESYTVGFLYVTGNVTASSGNNGIISGYKIDHNTGKLATINGLPVSSGGANPVRAVLTQGSRFLYVLNRGVSAAGSADCYGTGANECLNANITQFAVGGNGILTPQETFYTEGLNPFRLIADSSGNYLLALDHDAPDNVSPSSTDNCALALGTLGVAGGSPVRTCGDITVFKIDSTTGRLSLVENAQVTAANGSPITYFPVPANPVDFVFSGSYLLTLTGAPSPTTSYPYTGGTEVWPYSYGGSSGQLTLSQNGVQTLTASSGPMQKGTAIVNASGVIYVLDNELITTTFNGTSTISNSQILPFTVGSGGALQAEPSGIIPDDPTLANPIYVLVDSKGKYLYVANQGNNTTGNNPESGIAAYDLFTSPSYQLSFLPGGPFGSGSGPQCIVEDPSNQFIYEANEYSSNITGRVLDPNSGELDDMRVTSTYTLQGQPTWCLVDGRTS